MKRSTMVSGILVLFTAWACGNGSGESKQSTDTNPDLNKNTDSASAAFMDTGGSSAVDAGSLSEKDSAIAMDTNSTSLPDSKAAADAQADAEIDMGGETNTAVDASMETHANTTPTGPVTYKIGLSDVYILKRGRVASIQYAQDVGAQGVEADMGSLSGRETFYAKEGEELILDPAVAKLFVEDAKTRGVECASVGMAGFLAWDLSEYPTFLTKIIPDTIRTMKNVGAKVASLPIRGTNLKTNPEKRPGVIKQLQGAGALAVEAGVVFGIETTLSAAEEAKLLDEVGSPAIKTYFNIGQLLEEGRNVSEELKVFGRDRIVQIHISDRGTMREKIKEIRDTLKEMGWYGWLVIERAPGDGREGFKAAVTFLKSVFPTE
jgi:sugar phosphate isomerase/epimerase